MWVVDSFRGRELESMSRPEKYHNDIKVQIDASLDIPEGEYTIMWMFANDISMREIVMETGSHYETVSKIIRSNLLTMLKGKRL